MPSNFEQECVLREGRYSVVSRGRRAGDGAPVVLKRLRWLYPPAEQVAAFQREHDITRRVASPHVVEVRGLTESDGVFQLVLEDFGATDVGALYARGRAPLGEALEIGIAAARALVVLHECDVIHKDVNPTNIVRNPATGVVKLIDFGLSTTQRRQLVPPEPVASFEGTPLYMSPEQTGRTDVSLDWRTDLYSLGATLYALLLGRPPFVSDDRLELVHAHIARVPEAPHRVDAAIPRVVSDLVMRLLQKRPEHRYQSARGLLHDLERCRAMWLEAGAIEPFELRAHDLEDRLLVPEKLYGREREVAALRAAFERVAAGAREMLLIAGYSGIGKTSLVNQVHPAILERRGTFLSGKCEQFNRGVPYASVVQAFRRWLGQVLHGEPRAREQWRARIAAAVAPNGRVLTELIAELEDLLGPQAPVEEVSASDAQNRLFHTMSQLVRALGSEAHPLVLFLDDLQWADRPSLELSLRLATDPSTTHVLLLGAYRDNEVDASHPLSRLVSDIESAGGRAQTLALGPLAPGDTRALVADALGDDTRDVVALAQLCHEKTAGNPFFLGRFLLTLHERGLLRLDRAQRRWRWNLDAIAAEKLTDNVVDLMCARIGDLPPATRRALLSASIVGNSFTLETLSKLLEQDARATQADLRPALDAALVQAVDPTYWESETGAVPDYRYCFEHDRIQQAACLLLPEDERKRTHLALARLLQAAATDATDHDVLFDLVEHLNRAGELVTGAEPRRTAATLNLAAGRRALSAAAYAAAHEYLEKAISLCPPEVWSDDYELALELWHHAARAAYLAGAAEVMDRHVGQILRAGRTVLDRVRAMSLEVQARNSRSDFAGAIDRALEALAELGVHLPAHPTQGEIAEGLGAVMALVGARSVEEVVALPGRDDPTVRTILQLENLASVPAFLTRPALVPILAFDMVRTSIEQGISRESPYGFGLLGLFLCAIDMCDVAFTHARITLGLLDRFEDCPQRARATHLAAGFAKPWNLPLREVLDEELRVFALGVESGDLEYACWGAHIYCSNAFWGGLPLDALEREFATYIAACRSFKQDSVLHCNVQFQQAIKNLRGGAADPTRLVGPDFDEAQAIAAYKSMRYRGAVAVTCANMTLVRFVFGDHAGAAAASDEGVPYGDGALATFLHVGLRFYGALAHLQCATGEAEAPRTARLEVVATHRAVIATWARFCAANHSHRLALIDAERARLAGDQLAALEGYDSAIALARQNRYAQDEAIACELAGRFHLARGRTAVARAYLLEARFAWQKWGATAKVEQLTREFPDLNVAPDPGLANSSSVSTTGRGSRGSVGTSDLDVASVAKALGAIGSEGRLEPLLTRIVEVAIENAGATHGCLLLADKGTLTVAAALDAERTMTQPPGTPPGQVAGLSVTVVEQVLRSGLPVVQADARLDPVLRGEVPADRPRSILCVPVEHLGIRAGVLYLDNDLIVGAFPHQRLQIMQLLATQAAVTLERARLLEQTIAMGRALEQLVAGVAHELNTPLGAIQASVANISAAVTDSVHWLPALARAASREEFDAFTAILDATSAARQLATSREERSARRALRAQLESRGIVDATEVADRLVDLGIVDVVDGFEPALRSPRQAEFLRLALGLTGFRRNSANIQLAADRAAKIVVALKNYAHPVTADACTPASVADNVETVLTLYQSQLRRGVEVRRRFDAETVITARHDELNQVWTNLIHNAMQAMDFHGTMEVEVRRSDGGGVVVNVIDDGRGIPSDVQPRIFEPFFTTKAPGEGTGLGLSISRDIVGRHKGQITVTSRPGRTCFTVTLPACCEPAASHP